MIYQCHILNTINFTRFLSNKIFGFKCLCPVGFSGKLCDEPINGCYGPNPCINGGQCMDKSGSFKCRCPNGYAGKFCEYNPDECASNPCKNNGVCISKLDNFTVSFSSFLVLPNRCIYTLSQILIYSSLVSSKGFYSGYLW